jgi:hypothetical protein
MQGRRQTTLHGRGYKRADDLGKFLLSFLCNFFSGTSLTVPILLFFAGLHFTGAATNGRTNSAWTLKLQGKFLLFSLFLVFFLIWEHH